MSLKNKKTLIYAVIVLIGLGIAIAALVSGNFGTYEEGNTVTPECVFALVMFCIVFFCFATQILPLGVTAILGAFAMSAAGLTTYSAVLSNFASQTVMLITGMMIVGAAFREVGLAHDLGNFIIKHFAKRPKVFLITLILVTCLISAFMSNTASVVIFMAVASAAASIPGSKITRKQTFMAIGIASVVGGNLTLFASTTQVAVQGILEGLVKEDSITYRLLTNWDMLKVGLPLVVLLVLFFWFFGDKMQKKNFDFEEVPESIQVNINEEKPIWKKIVTLGVFVVCIVFFIIGEVDFNGFSFGLKNGTVAIIGGALCIATRCISEKKALHAVDWTSVVMLGGILGFSTAMKASGATALISGVFDGKYLPYLILVLVALVMTNLMSNTAVAVMLVPIGLEIALTAGVSPICYVMGILFAANTSYATPMSTVPITMTRIAGYRFKDYFKVGGAFTVIAITYILIVIPLMYNLF